jgi:hypothetical protein
MQYEIMPTVREYRDTSIIAEILARLPPNCCWTAPQRSKPAKKLPRNGRERASYVSMYVPAL